MKMTNKIGTLTTLAFAMLAAQAAQAQDTFINPEWANSATYIGAGIGQSRTNIDDGRVSNGLRTIGSTMNSFSADEKDVGYKLFVGKQLNRNFAVELGYFDLGKFNYRATTTNGGVVNGEAGYRGANLDLVAQYPLSQRFSLLGRFGLVYSDTDATFTGNRAASATALTERDRKVNRKIGVGMEYKFTEALALRAEIEDYKVNSSIVARGHVKLLSASLVYKLGRPAASRPVVVEAAPAPMPAPVVAQAPAPVAQPAPVPVSEKVSFAAETLFDFDKAVLKPEGKRALDDLLAKQEGMNTEVMIAIGHTDAIGTDAYNQKLSMRRSEAVKAYLVSKGLEQNRVYTEGKGETQPAADNATSEGRAKNRRVVVEVVGTRTVTK